MEVGLRKDSDVSHGAGHRANLPNPPATPRWFRADTQVLIKKGRSGQFRFSLEDRPAASRLTTGQRRDRAVTKHEESTVRPSVRSRSEIREIAPASRAT
jgi:hypothetical protein